MALPSAAGHTATGGEGLTLNEAQAMIYFSLGYNYATTSNRWAELSNGQRQRWSSTPDRDADD